MNPLQFIGEDMFVIVTYDVHTKRCTKIMKYLRQWLEHRQRSVFSGFLTDKQTNQMRVGLMKLVDAQYDSIIIFQSNRANQFSEWTTSRAAEARVTSMVVSVPNTRPSNARKRSNSKVTGKEGKKPTFRMKNKKGKVR